jgi:hypothetical protein
MDEELLACTHTHTHTQHACCRPGTLMDVGPVRILLHPPHLPVRLSIFALRLVYLACA